MAVQTIGNEAQFGITIESADYFVQSVEKKQSWETKTFMGANGVEGGGVQYKERVSISMTVIGKTAPSKDAAKTIVEALGYSGEIGIDDITESQKAEEFTEWSISATVYPDMKKAAGTAQSV